jgi:acetylornithine/N-succinyldiaminopimelate aminotransferase
MNRNETIGLDHEYLMQTYSRLNVVPSSGSGAVMKDADGKVYIDFTSGIGVNSLGYADAEWFEAVAAQAAKIQHFSNYYYCEGASALAEKLVRATGLARVFFCNSGAEANEGAIKTARKYSFDKYGEGRSTIITLRNSFHGRTITTLSATGQDNFHNWFFPFTEGFKYVEAGDAAALEAAVAEGGVCAVMLEFIQGEGGVNVLNHEYVKEIVRICDENDLLLIDDEVQTGIGRTGKMFACEHYGVIPDIITTAKGLGGGLPIGAFITGFICSEVLGAGMHGSTFGANPVACAGANVVIDRVSNQEFLNSVAAKGVYIRSTIKAWSAQHVLDVRGKGLMIGIKTDLAPKEVVHRAINAGVLVLTAGTDVVRLLPPLTISYEEIDRGLTLLKSAMK